MHVQSNHSTGPVVGEKRAKPLKNDPPQPSPDTRKVASFIQRFYLFGTNAHSTPIVPDKPGSPEVEQPQQKKAKAADWFGSKREGSPAVVGGLESSGTESPESTDERSSKEPSPDVQYPSYSVQRLRQFWTNRLLSSGGSAEKGGGTSIDTVVRKTKSATIGTPTVGGASRTGNWRTASPKPASRFQRNGSIGRSGRRRLAQEHLDTAQAHTAPGSPLPPPSTAAQRHKRTSNAALLSPDREPQRQVEKRQCVGAAGLAGAADSFPLVTSTPSGSRIHWARRTEILGIRALTLDDEQKRQADKMPIRVENYVNNFIGVDIQSVATAEDAPPSVVLSVTSPPPDASGEMAHHGATVEGGDEGDELPSGSVPLADAETPSLQQSASSSLLGRKGNTPTRKISFMNNISPYNRRLLAGNGTKVAALTSKFNQMIQQDAGLLEEVKKRGGYIHKCGNVAYKVLEDTSGGGGGGGQLGSADPYGFGSVATRNGSGRTSLRKKAASAAVATGAGSRTDDSSDEISSASSKSSSVRKAGVKKRPSLRKNIYRRPEWAETGRSSLGVRKVLELFEPNVHHHGSPRGRKSDGAGPSGHGDTGKPPPGRSKPKVPDKSEQVLQKTKDIKAMGVRPVASEGREPECGSASEREDRGTPVPSTGSAREEPQPAPQEVPNSGTADTNSQSTEVMLTDTNVTNAESNQQQDTQAPVDEANLSQASNTVQQLEESLKSAESKEKGNTQKEKKEKKKSTVSKIYERFTFRSSKKIPIDTSVASDKVDNNVVLREEPADKTAGTSRRSFITSIEIPTIRIEDSESERQSPESSTKEADVSEQKILEAICAASQRIDSLSKSFNDLTLNDPEETVVGAGKETQPNPDRRLPVLANTSFLFRGSGGAGGSGALAAASRNASHMNIVEAVNTVVINKCVSMDDHHFPCARGSAGRMSLNERSVTQRDLEDDDYELVTKPEEKQAASNGLLPATVDGKRSVQSASSPTISIDLTELTSKIESFIHKSKRESENIYQSITRAVEGEPPRHHLMPDDAISINSYESFENYESIELETAHANRQHGPDGASREEDTYEICSPPPELPPARDDSRNDLTLPQPKRNLSSSPKTLPKHLQVTYQSNYEKIKYSKIPPRPPKPEEVPLPPRNNSAAASAAGSANTTTTASCASPSPAAGDRLNITLESVSSAELPPLGPGGDLLDKSPHGQHGEHGAVRQESIYEENIYDTIRSADDTVDYDDPACGGSAELEVPLQNRRLYEQQQQQQQRLRKPPSPPADTVSLVSSNCYESIGSRLEFVRNMALNRRTIGGSTTTLASDHITNSLYGTTAGLASLTPPSERGSDTSNSADWTDISDEDEGECSDGVAALGAAVSRRPNFIVIRERKRTHQTPLRARKLARITHPKTDDDSDHHYESLYAVGSTECYHRGGSGRSRASGESVGPASGVHATEVHGNGKDDDEFDSFDSDETEDEEEEDGEDGEDGSRNRTDSGVDIRNAKLPDPPPSSSQVYVLVQKIKNLGTTLSKSEIAKGFHKLSKRKPSAKGAAATATYESAPTVLPPKPKAKAMGSSKAFKLPPLPLVGGGVPRPPPEDYENAPFGRHPSPAGSSSPLPPPSSAVSSSASCVPGATALLSSPAPDPAPGVRSTSESSNVSGNRKKSKSTKSLRSKLRKSLASDSAPGLNIGSSFNGSRSTFYVSAASTGDVDSGIFHGMEAFPSPTAASSPAEPATEPKPKTVELDNRRRSLALGGGTISSHRPSIPPPPPPAADSGPKGNTSTTPPARKLGATLWYAECAVFKQPHSFATEQPACGGSSPRSPLPPKEPGRATTSAPSCYADIYQTSGASVASSSESSGVSTGGEGGPGDDHSHSMFVNEPLYQIYNAAKLESITRDIDAEISGRTMEELYDDGYEKISERNRRRAAAEEAEERGSTSGGSSTDGDDRSESSRHLRKPARPTALELIEPHVGKLRTLWCEVPEVRNSEILATLTPTEKRLQEAKFEILTSEASYLKSLNLLRTHFVNHPAFRDQRVLSPADRKTLFSSIIPVQECSDRLLCDLEHCWQDNIMLLGLSHSIHKHAEKHFHVYVSYCEHQAKIDRTLKALKATRPDFGRTLAELEADPVCCSLSLSSFLMLPMQRITRMRLLLDAVLQRCHPDDDDECASWEKTFLLINRILTQCNDAAHRSEQVHEMERLSRQIEFPTHVRPLAIVPCGIGAAPSSMHRKLEKRGELVHLLWRGDDAKLTFGKKFSKSNVYAFLFTDLLVLTKRKSDESFLVIDYCQRALLTVASGDIVPGLPAKEMQTIGKNLIIMTLLENHEGKTVEMIVSCPSETERERWLMVTEPPASENPDEKIYEQWDCPQVIAVHPYQALQPDELDLDIKDVVNVHRKMADGWYEGERIRDGAVGWFPSNYTKEIPSVHIRAKHVKQRHMLLTYTSKYIDTAGKGHHTYHNHHYHYGKK